MSSGLCSQCWGPVDFPKMKTLLSYVQRPEDQIWSWSCLRLFMRRIFQLSFCLFLPGAIECLLNHPDRKFRSMHCLRSFKFQICCHFPACSYWKRRAFDLQLVSWSQESGTGNFSSESNLVMLCWSMSGSLMSLNWHSVFWLRAGLGTTYSNKDKSLC